MIFILLLYVYVNIEDIKIFKGNIVLFNGFGRRLRVFIVVVLSFINCVKLNVFRWNWLKLDLFVRSCN